MSPNSSPLILVPTVKKPLVKLWHIYISLAHNCHVILILTHHYTVCYHLPHSHLQNLPLLTSPIYQNFPTIFVFSFSTPSLLSSRRKFTKSTKNKKHLITPTIKSNLHQLNKHDPRINHQVTY